MRLTAALLALLTAGLWQGVGVPHSWALRLTPTCRWEAAGWAKRLSPAHWGPTQAERRATAACWARRGSHDPWRPTPSVKTLLAKFPSAAQIAAWEREADAKGDPLLSPGP